MNDSLIIAIGNKLIRDSFSRQKALKEIIKKIKTDTEDGDQKITPKDDKPNG